jgi:hypothetical protein
MKLINKVDSLMLKAKLKVDSFLNDEKGDTNFISILVLLGIALALAGVFLAFKDQVITWVDTNIGTFFSESGGR